VSSGEGRLTNGMATLGKQRPNDLKPVFKGVSVLHRKGKQRQGLGVSMVVVQGCFGGSFSPLS
jgi:hypothetical protein